MKIAVIALPALVLAVLAAGTGCKSEAPRKLTAKDLQSAFSEATGGAHLMDSFDQKVSSVKSKLGAPHKSEGEAVSWLGVSPKDEWAAETCYELSMDPKKGSSVAPTDKTKCGI